jgi:hypothetical protein
MGKNERGSRMNTHIDEDTIFRLAEESGLIFERDYLRYEEIRFAELIAQECAKNIEKISESTTK